MKDKNLFYLIILLLIKAFVLVFLLDLSKITLSPDEAQYWTWSQAIDWGYYSKPPGIAWEIYLGTWLFQNHEFGVRFMAAIVGFCIPIATYFLAKSASLNEKVAFWSAVMIAFSPLGFAASFLATTDGSMVFFWILASIILVKALQEEKQLNFVLLGVIIACGALFKWPIYLFWLFPLFFKRFWTPSLLMGILISLMGLIPSLIWNMQHDFATFRHVFSTVKGAPNHVTSNFFEFLGAQVALVSPILFILLVLSFIYFVKNRSHISKELQFCALSCFSILSILAINACFKKMQGNWGIFAYPAGFVFLAYVMSEKIKWIKIGVVFSILLTFFVALIPYAEMKGMNVPYRFNAFRHTMGWGELPKVLQQAGFDPSKDFLFGDKYQMSSILSFYNPTQKRAYFFNLHGIRKNQFSYFPSMQEKEIGKDGYFVLVENAPHLDKNELNIITDYEALLSRYFKKVQFMGVKPLFMVAGKVVKGAFIFKCIDYNGQAPPKTLLY